MTPTNAEKLLQVIVADLIVGKHVESIRMRTSKRGVPHLVVTPKGSETKHSVCYFIRKGLYKVWWPWPSENGKQDMAVFDTPQKVVEFIVERAVG